MDMRHRSTPVQTCQRYALRRDRVNSPAGVGFWVKLEAAAKAPVETFSTDTPMPGDISADTCGQLLIHPHVSC